MNRKLFFTAFCELVVEYFPKFQPFNHQNWFWKMLPTPGNVIFTLLAILVILGVQRAGAFPLVATNAVGASTSTIAYQGRLANASGEPLTGMYEMLFRFYNADTGGSILWEEKWENSNSVVVSDGLFNVMLGSLNAIPHSVVTNNSNLWLGITVDTDLEMKPRVQLGSVPISMQALTIPDNSVTTPKLADGSVTKIKLGPDVQLIPSDGSITTAKLANGAVTADKLHKPYYGGMVNSGTATGQFRMVHVTFSQPFSAIPAVIVTSDDLDSVADKTFNNVLFVTASGFDIRWYKRSGADFTSSDPSVKGYWIAVGQ